MDLATIIDGADRFVAHLTRPPLVVNAAVLDHLLDLRLDRVEIEARGRLTCIPAGAMSPTPRPTGQWRSQLCAVFGEQKTPTERVTGAESPKRAESLMRARRGSRIDVVVKPATAEGLVPVLPVGIGVTDSGNQRFSRFRPEGGWN
jgi:hypothetical protein